MNKPMTFSAFVGVLVLAMVVVFFKGAGQEEAPAPATQSTDAAPATAVVEADPAAVTAGYPPEMLYNGRAIDPECFTDAAPMTAPGIINLAACGQGAATPDEEGMPVREGALRALDNGYIGYEYFCQLPEDKIYCGSFYYRYDGMTDKGVVISSAFSGGGSGHFTTLGIYQREGDTLRHVETIDGGDRCTGGLTGDVRVENGRISYARFATPYALYDMYQGDAPAVEPYDDLFDCAACCAAEIGITDGTVTGVTLTMDETWLQHDENLPRLQGCFNGVYVEELKNGRRRMDEEQARAFIARFAASCVATPEPAREN